jgi:hypothetical protein
MDPSSSKRVILNTNLHIDSQQHVETEIRPHKFQKLSTSVEGSSGGYINIPEFIGPTPILQHHNNNYYQHNSNSNANLHQHGNNNQERPRNTSENNSGYQQTNDSQTPAEDPFCWYQEDHIQEGIQHCQQSLIGKILTDKIIPKQIIQNTLLGIWGNPKGFQITEVEGGLFHLNLDMEKDIQRAIKGNPWTIRNSWFMLQLWDREKDPKELEFHKVPIWIQLRGLPLHCKTIAMGKHLGSQLGMVEDAALYDFPDKARIVKIRVEIDTNQPIRPRIFIGNTKDGIKWVDFRYENLPMFCFLCGYIGHNESNCTNQAFAMDDGSTNPRDPWLRSNSYGRRINDKRDSRFNSDPMKSMSGGSFSPVPKAKLDMLAKMTLEEKLTTAASNPTQESIDKAKSSNSTTSKT